VYNVEKYFLFMMRSFLLFVVLSFSLMAQARIAIVIDDMAHDMPLVNAFIDLPKEITLAFMPDSENLEILLEKAREKGHDILAHVPMEAFRDPSTLRKNLLLVGDSRETIQQKLEWHLKQVKGCIGINNHTGSAFTSSYPSMCPVMEVLKEKKLFFFDSFTFHASQGKKAADAYGVPCLIKDIFLDNNEETEKILAQLKTLEEVAKKRGTAIAIGHPKPGTLAALKSWLSETSVVVVPLSKLFKE
jgi:polysaccharide deacetylase 2 family uncharacterized protein YibQ